MKNVLVRMDEELLDLLRAGVSATQLDQSELVRQGLRAGVPKVIRSILQARSETLHSDRQAMAENIRRKSGQWRGFKGTELLHRTRS